MSPELARTMAAHQTVTTGYAVDHAATPAGLRPPLRPMQLSRLPDCPLVSIIMSNHNYQRFIGEAIDSALGQTYPHFELLICDDGSTDASRVVIHDFAARDERIVPLFKENGGQASGWNVAYAHSRGQLICFLDSDDAFMPDKLERLVRHYQEHPQAGLVYHRLLPVARLGQPLGPPFQRHQYTGWLVEFALKNGGLLLSAVTSSAVSLRRELADEVFPLPLAFRRGFSDLYIQSVAQFLTEVSAIPDALSSYRIHGENFSVERKPTPKSLEVIMDGNLSVFPYVQAFVRGRCGDDIADRLVVEDLGSYWNYVAALYLLNGKPLHGSYGHQEGEIRAHLTGHRARLWQAIFALPRPLASRALGIWWGHARWKGPIRSLLTTVGYD